MAIETVPQPSIPITTPFRPGLGFLTATPIIAAATICLVLVIASAILAPWLSPHDPLLLAPAQRLKPASAQFLLGTDGYGRDVLSRILYGGRISLLIGVGAAVVSIGIGLVIGLVSGFFKWVDGDPEHPARHCRGLAVGRQPDDRAGRHHHSANSDRGPAGALGRAVGARGTLCGSRDLGRLQPAQDHVAASFAEHDRAADRARYLYLRV